MIELKREKDNLIVVRGKIYIVCSDCGKLVQVNKFLFGSLHVCLSEEELKQRKIKEGV